MNRSCRIFDVTAFKSEFPQFANSNVEIWIDEDNAESILTFLLAKNKKGILINYKKFKRILYVALSGGYDIDFYDREEVSQKATNVTAMKFKQKANIRIACKEYFDNNKKIVMISHFHKKTQSNDKRTKIIYETVGGYDYEFK